MRRGSRHYVAVYGQGKKRGKIGCAAPKASMPTGEGSTTGTLHRGMKTGEGLDGRDGKESMVHGGEMQASSRDYYYFLPTFQGRVPDDERRRRAERNRKEEDEEEKSQKGSGEAGRYPSLQTAESACPFDRLQDGTFSSPTLPAVMSSSKDRA